ncbi:hypothetical protein F5Y18DRAFT_378806 [Xylariaceae sp. FL1019]|nr:hypothetical protein F5Y18DRAFT_378806 [Xylariaceae sp. FL1019]
MRAATMTIFSFCVTAALGIAVHKPGQMASRDRRFDQNRSVHLSKRDGALDDQTFSGGIIPGLGLTNVSTDIVMPALSAGLGPARIQVGLSNDVVCENNFVGGIVMAVTEAGCATYLPFTFWNEFEFHDQDQDFSIAEGDTISIQMSIYASSNNGLITSGEVIFNNHRTKSTLRVPLIDQSVLCGTSADWLIIDESSLSDKFSRMPNFDTITFNNCAASDIYGKEFKPAMDEGPITFGDDRIVDCSLDGKDSDQVVCRFTNS